MDSQDLKLVFVFSLTCAVWYCAGFMAGYVNACDTAYEDGKIVGHDEGVLEASRPTEQ